MSEGERSNGLPAPREARRADDFDAVYVAGRPPWDIGRPQSAFRPKVRGCLTRFDAGRR
jgi:hypothetical protein